jgi:hypothetical protein
VLSETTEELCADTLTCAVLVKSTVNRKEIVKNDIVDRVFLNGGGYV